MTIASFTSGPPAQRTDADLIGSNKRFYDALWSEAKLFSPEQFNTWPLVAELVAQTSRRLEVAPGLRPRLPPGGHPVRRPAAGPRWPSWVGTAPAWPTP